MLQSGPEARVFLSAAGSSAFGCRVRARLEMQTRRGTYKRARCSSREVRGLGATGCPGLWSMRFQARGCTGDGLFHVEHLWSCGVKNLFSMDRKLYN